MPFKKFSSVCAFHFYLSSFNDSALTERTSEMGEDEPSRRLVFNPLVIYLSSFEMLPGQESKLKPTTDECPLCECPGELFDLIGLSITQCNVKYIKYSTFFYFSLFTL